MRLNHVSTLIRKWSLSSLVGLVLMFGLHSNVNAQAVAALMTVDDGKFVMTATLDEHQKVGDWRMTRSNKYVGSGDFDGDGLTDFIITSEWGIGIMTFEDGSWKNLCAQQNGFGIGEYLFNSGTDVIQGVVDLDGDGADEIIAFNDWGMAVLKWDQSRIKVIYAAPDGTDFNGWKLRVDRDKFWGAGDTDGDGKEDIVLSSSWGMGILRYKDDKLDLLASASNGVTMDEDLTYTTYRFKNMGVGDFDGDGMIEFVCQSDYAILFLRFHNYLIEATTSIRTDDMIENFRMVDPMYDKVALIADLDGNRRMDFVIKSVGDLGYIKRTAEGFTSLAKVRAGTRLGERRMALEDDVVGAGDFNNDGVMDVVIRGDMGMNIINEHEGLVTSLGASPNKGEIGKWKVEADDVVVNVGQYGAPGKYHILVRKK